MVGRRWRGGAEAAPVPGSGHRCVRLLSYLEDRGNYNEDAVLQMAGTTWPGYADYHLVHAAGGAQPLLQQRLTVRVGNLQDVDWLLRRETMIWNLVQEVREQLGAPPSSRSRVAR